MRKVLRLSDCHYITLDKFIDILNEYKRTCITIPLIKSHLNYSGCDYGDNPAVDLILTEAKDVHYGNIDMNDSLNRDK